MTNYDKQIQGYWGYVRLAGSTSRSDRLEAEYGADDLFEEWLRVSDIAETGSTEAASLIVEIARAAESADELSLLSADLVESFDESGGDLQLLFSMARGAVPQFAELVRERTEE